MWVTAESFLGGEGVCQALGTPPIPGKLPAVGGCKLVLFWDITRQMAVLFKLSNTMTHNLLSKVKVNIIFFSEIPPFGTRWWTLLTEEGSDYILLKVALRLLSDRLYPVLTLIPTVVSTVESGILFARFFYSWLCSDLIKLSSDVINCRRKKWERKMPWLGLVSVGISVDIYAMAGITMPARSTFMVR